MSAPGTEHLLRAYPTDPNPEHVAFLMQLDPATPPTCPHSWTIGGRLLNPAQLDMAHRITKADADYVAELHHLTGERRMPEGIIGESEGGPVVFVNDIDPPPAA